MIERNLDLRNSWLPLAMSPSSAEAIRAMASAATPAPADPHSTMGRIEKPHLDIVLDAPFLTLRGTGPDVEPTSLSGHVALYLTESTSIREITLQFRGKAKIPMPASESLMNSSTSITYVVCNHDWSFLEGDKRHSRTLKAGRHYFPFHLEIGGSLPSAIHTTALGGASVAYKLRAVAQRPGLAHNLHAIAPIHIVRTFTHEALEYQQTLEIENTWPEKLMYAIMLPHKAWPAGDALIAVLKLSPLAKGVAVTSIITSLHENTKIYARSGAQEDTRVVASARHDIIDGRAVEIDGPPTRTSANPTPAPSRPPSAQGNRAAPRPTSFDAGVEEDAGFENHDIITYVRLIIPPSSPPSSAAASAPPTPAPAAPPALMPVPGTFGFPDPPYTSPPLTPAAGPSTYFSSHPTSAQTAPTSPAALPTSTWPNLPSHAHTPAPLPHPTTLVTPSHSLEPITVSHRVRWSIFLRNRDGHTSELRCSLPVVILDGRVRREARAASSMTRKLMLGSVGLTRDAERAALGEYYDPTEGPGGHTGFRPAMLLDAEDDEDDESPEGRELPSYNAHVRDRVANMFLPEAVTMRVTNPWLGRMGSGSDGASPASLPEHAAGQEMQIQQPTPVRPDAAHITQSPSSGSLSSHALTRDMSTLSLSSSDPASAQHSPHHLSQTQTPHPSHTVPAHAVHTQQGAVRQSLELDWVNSELMLSLGDERLRRLGVDGAGTPGSYGSTSSAHGGTTTILAAGMRTPPVAPQYVAGPNAVVAAVSGAGRWGGASRAGSRPGSRAASPERGASTGTSAEGGAHHHPHQGPSSSHLAHGLSALTQAHFVGGPKAVVGRPGSAGASRAGSRAGSRPGSPVRGASAGAGVGANTVASASAHGVPAAFGYGYEPPPPPPPQAPTVPATVHAQSSGASPTASTSALGLHLHTGSVEGDAASAGSGYASSTASASASASASAAPSTYTPSTHGSTHSHAPSVRALQGLFKATMKPFTALAHHGHGHSHHWHGKEKEGHGKEKEKERGRRRSTSRDADMDAADAVADAGESSAALSRVSSGEEHDVYQHHSVGVGMQSTSALPGPPGANSTPPAAPHSFANPRLVGTSAVVGTPSPLSAPAASLAFNPPTTHTNTLSFASSSRPTSPAQHALAYTQHPHTGFPFHHSAATAPTSPAFGISPHTNTGTTLGTGTGGRSASSASLGVLAAPALLHRALTEVPDYAVAARGFLGGVPPLSSMRGLPSYEEAARGSASASASASTSGSVPPRAPMLPQEEEEGEEDEDEDAGIEMRTRTRHRSPLSS